MFVTLLWNDQQYFPFSMVIVFFLVSMCISKYSEKLIICQLKLVADLGGFFSSLVVNLMLVFHQTFSIINHDS